MPAVSGRSAGQTAALARQPARYAALLRSALCAVLLLLPPLRPAARSEQAAAASLSARDLEVLSRTLAFIKPPPASMAIAFAPGNPASRYDAAALIRATAAGLPSGGVLLHPELVDSRTVAAGHYGLVIAAAGANGPDLSAAVRASRSICVTGEIEAVQAGLCTMAIRSEPRVEIVVNHAAAVAAGVEFTAAFRMMIREL